MKMYLSLLVRSYLSLGLHEKAHNSFSYKVGSRRILHQNCRVQWDVKLCSWYIFLISYIKCLIWVLGSVEQSWTETKSTSEYWVEMVWTRWKILRSQVWILELHNCSVLSPFFYHFFFKHRRAVFHCVLFYHCRFKLASLPPIQKPTVISFF